MLAAFLALALASPVAPRWLVFDLVDPAVAGGHRLLHLEDVVGPGRRADIPGLPAARAVLLVSLAPEDCVSPSAGLCAELAALTASAREAGGLVVGVVLSTREGSAAARAKVRTASPPFPVTLDLHRVARHALGFERPGQVILVDGGGVGRRLDPIPADRASEARARALEALRGAFDEAVRGDDERP
jgi:hypothetical protein